ncbi:lysophospholipid acyltransferase family protein [Arsenicicoccus dermatophilus]|uniref:lysophospholipid acyltransferase family protein n=1 Tax=Arsenicicoccus dermatophilus TaxID=1076331 RepID=UPI001F4CD87D|nr:lysophospholipid acyltransferase family protein [Arsenicicoccus dermatophilus]MCH8613380.1 1-acyl-sn-glycerol-3-phosphate acyltransferase [Arsenicicoccus dermatophilus]
MASVREMLQRDPVYTPVVGAVRALFAAQGTRFKITGAHHVPQQGPAVMMINHTGYFDFMYAGWAALPAGRLVRFMAKESIFRNAVAGPLMRGMRHISVDRSAGAGAYADALRALRAGEIIGIFPEATISMSFEPKAFKSGAVRMAQETGAPILPVAIWGSQRVWTKALPKRLGRHHVPVGITVGPPVHVGPQDDVVEVTARIRETMIAMLHELQEVYPAWPVEERRLLPQRLGGTAPSPEEAARLEAELRAKGRTQDPVAVDPAPGAPAVGGPRGTASTGTGGRHRS